MISLITGASSGIGRDMAFEFADRGYDLILVARSFDRLKEVKNEIIKKYDKCNVLIMKCDVSNVKSVKNLYNDVRKEFVNIDVLVNNAGFGDCGKFYETDLEKDISMINTNILGLHVLTKLFLQDMVKVNKGYILNIASIAGFMPGPLMATYYSTKAYVVRLTRAIAKELKVDNSKVRIAAFCPGPVNTEFDKNANVTFSLKGQSSSDVSKIGVNGLFKSNKIVYFSSILIRIVACLAKIMPESFMANQAYRTQKRKLR
ncbi:MAG: SDR family oxidoreductase [Clostridiales bacterium]|jgi:oxidoreductase, short chain dehydrogenase/reductase family|nr:SDR family oxidoreductase [Clostridiales bacterium]